MSDSSPTSARSILESARAWFTKGAEAERAGLEPGWEYLDINEFIETPAEAAAWIEVEPADAMQGAEAEIEIKRLRDPRAQRVDVTEGLADIVGDVISDIEAAGDDIDPTILINKRGKHVITVISGKGGVGKTTVLLGLAGAAASQGQRVLLIDLDPQGSLTLAAVDGHVGRSVRDAFDDVSVSQVVVPAHWEDFKGSVDIAPSNRQLAQVDLPVSALHAHSILVHRLGDLSQYDLVLVDAPATLATLSFEAVALAHSVLIVTEPTRFGLSSAADAQEFANIARRGKRNWGRNVHVLLNKFDDSEESAYRAKELRSNFGTAVLSTMIEVSDEINFANGAGVPVQLVPSAEAQWAAGQFSSVLKRLTR